MNNSTVETIEALTTHIPIATLQAAFQRVSTMYRELRFFPFESEIDYLVYLLVRLPATFAVATHVFQRVQECMPGWHPHRVVDIGAGPGAVALALEAWCHPFPEIVAIERDPQFITLAKKLVPHDITWISSDVLEVEETKQFQADLSIMSYSLGEMDSARREKSILLATYSPCIVLIEPGTPTGYETLLSARNMCIARGYQVVAPCPHSLMCPLQRPDWCHFSCRLPRSRIHKGIKEASMGYEDEKFIYMVLTHKEYAEISCCHERIIRDPVHRSGHSRFTVCCDDGRVCEKIVSRKQPMYKTAKKAEWGDALS